MHIGDLVYFNDELHIITNIRLILYKKSKKIIKYADILSIKNNTGHSCPLYWLDHIEQSNKNN